MWGTALRFSLGLSQVLAESSKQGFCWEEGRSKNKAKTGELRLAGFGLL